ncbi:OmpA family protein [Lutibacter sp. B2]|nr:OmpA family protein [Lutibacter sp. B2]
MKIFGKDSGKTDTSGEDLWSSIADLMSGLMIIFLFIAIAFMSQINKENENMIKEKEAIHQILQTYETIKLNIYKDLDKEFKDDLAEWKLDIDPDSLVVTFREPDVFFTSGSSELKTEFKQILHNFFPRYINIINGKYKANVSEVRIEGYTSSEWGENSTTLTSYFGNMELSQDRTRNVLNYVMGLEELKPHQEWLIEHITANGMSYSHRHYDSMGKENYKKSRRVEFRVITNAEDIISDIITEYRGVQK